MRRKFDARLRRSRSARRAGQLLATLTALGALGGCATSAQSLGVPDIVGSPRVDGIDRLGSGRTGARVPLAADGLSGVTEVIVGRPYAAASGRRCRPLADTDGIALGRIVCKSDGHWRLVRSLEPSGSVDRGRFKPETVRATASGGTKLPDSAALPYIEEMVKVDLRSDETLWSFAERVTGEGNSWRRIAALNGIDESISNRAERRLIVPIELLRD